MAEIKFSCPQCNQHITADELWGGHELQCPGCQRTLLVPAIPGEAPASVPNSLVPTPPSGGPKISLNRPQAHATGGGAGGAAPNKPIPIRNLAPTIRKKQNPVVKFAIGAAVVVVLGTGGYFGFIWVSGYQAKLKAKSAEADKNADGGQVGHIAEVNAVMDATDPSKAAPNANGQPAPRRNRPAAGQPSSGAPADATAAASATPADNSAIVPPAYTLDLAVAKIPDSRVNGLISGTNFLMETARVDPVGTAQVLRLMQGPAVSPDREVLVYLHLKPGEKIGGQTLSISQDMRGQGVPQVSKRWKMNPRYAATLRSYSTGYVLKLELGQLAENVLPGKIYLSFPDTEQSVVAGSFKATVTNPDPNLQVMPVASPTTPTTPSAAQSAMDQRYGIRR